MVDVNSKKKKCEICGKPASRVTCGRDKCIAENGRRKTRIWKENNKKIYSNKKTI